MIDPNQKSLALDVHELAREIAHGPSFFDAKGKLTAAVERYTGGRVAMNKERCRLVAALKLLKYSDRQIAQVVGCDTRSIPLMVAESERNGWIPALKERLCQLVAANAEQSSIALSQLLDETLAGERSLDLAAMLKSVGQVNTFLVEKHQLLIGAATEIREVRTGPSQAEVDAWARENAIEVTEIRAAVDYESSGTVEISEENNELSSGDSCHDSEGAGGRAAELAATEGTADANRDGGGIAFCRGGGADKMG